MSSSLICARCANLDLDTAIQRASNLYRDIKNGTALPPPPGLVKSSNGRLYYSDAICIHEFGARLSIPSNCPLCTFFRALRVKVQPDIADQRYKLLAFRSSESWMFRLDSLQNSGSWDEIQDTVFMAVVPDDEEIPSCCHEEFWLEKDIPSVGGIYRLRAEESTDTDPNILVRAREMDGRVNLGLVRSWLDDICRKHHGKACGLVKDCEPVERGFRLIDCWAKEPAVKDKAWGATYAALSYVWGTSLADMEDWPTTVLDAIAVTKELGLRYLWVDRLCINQNDTEEKGYLISRMTTIYEAADFTIVAAAGSGASHGLPGVRSTSRNPQPKYFLDSGSLLLSTFPDPRRDVLESSHWTRGWTYQEGILSKRRIVFTENQVYWECQGMATQESLNMPLFLTPAFEDRVDDSELRMADFMLTGIFKTDAYSGGISSNQADMVIMEDDAFRLDYGFPVHQGATTRAQLRSLNEHIRAFSKRNLSYDSDVLPAFSGILGMYKSNEDLSLLHGMPIWYGDICTQSGAQISFALTVTSWYHRAGSSHQLFVSEPCERRTHLPSWCWAAWKGPVTWRSPPDFEHGAFLGDLIATDVETPIYLRDRSAPTKTRIASENPTLMHIKAPLVLKYFHRIPTKKQWSWVRRPGRPGRESLNAESTGWDETWHRIAGRLSFIAVSVPMTGEEWTRGHEEGRLVSVLLFASKDPSSEHSRARFLTVRKVESADREGEREGRCERVGVVMLIVPSVSLVKCASVRDFLKQIPVHEGDGEMVVQ
ncbi:heterokaryon incompatibility protein-domain-containing protein [Rhexocercosporidium sp. MPI-PUGE-AT-0058]|nr:heterokaryon incompatibility protein-domain-containing protein [Rhexocercosporidium sp. MPI-PUGE-AT-0058]